VISAAAGLALALGGAAAQAQGRDMNEKLVAALDRAIAGDEKALQGVGVEQITTYSGTWVDRESVDGAGNASCLRRGSDGLGEEIGLFGVKLAADELKAALQGARALASAQLRPSRAEPYEVRVQFQIVAGGEVFRYSTGTQDPEAMMQLDPLAMPLQKLLGKLLQNPVRTLKVEVDAPESVASGPLPLTVRLVNRAAEGYWIPNPAALPNKPEGERVEAWYAPKLVFEKGVTPVPVTPSRTMLAPADKGPQPELVWVPAKGAASVALQGRIEVPAGAKELDLGVDLVVDRGEDQVAGKPRFRGAARSAVRVIKVR
jgi:hypothetical protein